MSKRAVFPGSFDPFTRGHESVVRKALPLFDEIIIAIGQNSTKNSYFPLEHRSEWIRKTFTSEPKVNVDHFTGLTVDYCVQNDCAFLLRGLRNARDFEFESSIAQMNEALQPEITTVLLVCDPRYAAINSTIVREIHKNGGDIAQFLPEGTEIDL